MKILEKTIKEIEKLDSNELLIVNEFINSIRRKKQKQSNTQNNSKSSLKEVREYLDDLESSLSQDIIESRKDRM